jgi:hypothetical protein
MQGYYKGRDVPFIPVNYNGEGETSMQGYIKGIERLFIMVHYNG